MRTKRLWRVTAVYGSATPVWHFQSAKAARYRADLLRETGYGAHRGPATSVRVERSDPITWRAL